MSGIESQTTYYGQTFEALSRNAAMIEQSEFEECAFIACSFHEIHWRGCTFLNCLFKECQWHLNQVTHSSFKLVRFEDSTVVGVDWTQAAWPKKSLFRALQFTRCVLNHSTFIGLNLRDLHLVECVAHDVDFEDADLTQAICRGTDFTNSRFCRTNLTKADFSSARNYSIAAQQNTLKKTKFSLPEALSLLDHLDIILTDDI